MDDAARDIEYQNISELITAKNFEGFKLACQAATTVNLPDTDTTNYFEPEKPTYYTQIIKAIDFSKREWNCIENPELKDSLYYKGEFLQWLNVLHERNYSKLPVDYFWELVSQIESRPIVEQTMEFINRLRYVAKNNVGRHVIEALICYCIKNNNPSFYQFGYNQLLFPARLESFFPNLKLDFCVCRERYYQYNVLVTFLTNPRVISLNTYNNYLLNQELDFEQILPGGKNIITFILTEDNPAREMSIKQLLKFYHGLTRDELAQIREFGIEPAEVKYSQVWFENLEAVKKEDLFELAKYDKSNLLRKLLLHENNKILSDELLQELIDLDIQPWQYYMSYHQRFGIELKIRQINLIRNWLCLNLQGKVGCHSGGWQFGSWQSADANILEWVCWGYTGKGKSPVYGVTPINELPEGGYHSGGSYGVRCTVTQSCHYFREVKRPEYQKKTISRAEYENKIYVPYLAETIAIDYADVDYPIEWKCEIIEIITSSLNYVQKSNLLDFLLNHKSLSKPDQKKLLVTALECGFVADVEHNERLAKLDVDSHKIHQSVTNRLNNQLKLMEQSYELKFNRLNKQYRDLLEKVLIIENDKNDLIRLNSRLMDLLPTDE